MKGSNKKKKAAASVIRFLAMAFTVTACVIIFSIRWALVTWKNLKMEELIYELKAPLEGTGGGMIGQYILNAIVPSACIWAALLLLSRFLKKKGKRRILMTVLMVLISGAVLLVSAAIFYKRLEVGTWLRGLKQESAFIEEHYVDPDNVKLTFPEKKRNLIYIYLESMETTFADTASGGAFEENVIPELTKLAQENEDFSGNSEELNGGISYDGSTWTMGAIFAQTTGLPLKLSIGSNNMDAMDSFFPEITALGDILKDEGYHQTFILGSDATFGGRRLYFTEHGDYEFQDYLYAKEQGLIPEDYKVFWGYEDKKLFEFAKQTLTKLAASEEPFNCTLLTVDTHFEDGYVCDLCGDEFGDNQYANVFACSSRQVTEFVQWIEQQDFFENTTVIISGDHPTMDGNFCLDVPSEYSRRVYTAYINADAEVKDPEACRQYSTFDAFPTTLAALGVDIEGNKLGLGTNLFSGEATLSEQFTKKEVNTELKKKSTFLQTLEHVDTTSEKYLQKLGFEPNAALNIDWTAYNAGEGKVTFEVDDFLYLFEPIKSVRVQIKNRKADEPDVYEMHLDADGVYRAEIPVTKEQMWRCVVQVIGTGESGKEYRLLSKTGPMALAARRRICDYLRGLQQLSKNYSIFFAARSDIAKGLTEEMLQELRNLGLQETPELKESYAAVIDSGKVIEEKAAFEKLDLTGTLKDGTPYEVLSGGKNCGYISQVYIDGENYGYSSMNGLTVIVYNRKTHRKIDRILLDTSAGEPSATIEIGEPSLIDHTTRIKVSKIKNCTQYNKAGNMKPDQVTVEIWDAETPEEITTVELTNKNNGVFLSNVDLTAYKGKQIYMRFRTKNSSGRQYIIDKLQIDVPA